MQEFSLKKSPFLKNANNKEYYLKEVEVQKITFKKYGKITIYLEDGEIFEFNIKNVKKIS